MKKFISFSCLVLLAACGGSNGSGGNKSIKRYEDALMSMERGLVVVETRTGREHVYLEEDGRMSARAEDVNEQTTSIVLKIEGTKLYKYVENKNFLGFGEDVRSVTVETFSMEEFQKLMKLPGARISNDQFILNTEMPFEGNYGGAKIVSLTQVTMNVDLKNPHCSMVGKNVDKKNEIIQDGVTTRLENLTLKFKTGCLPTLTNEQLKGLNLVSIRFCEKTKEPEVCKDDQDMSHLTFDL